MRCWGQPTPAPSPDSGAQPEAQGGGSPQGDVAGVGGWGCGVGETRATRWTLRPLQCGAASPSLARAAVSAASGGISSPVELALRHQRLDTLPCWGSFRVGEKNNNGLVASQRLLQSVGRNQQWPTCGQISDITPGVWGATDASKRRTKLVVARKWVDWLCSH